MGTRVVYRIAENGSNFSIIPWRDAIGIERVEYWPGTHDEVYAVPALVCWFTRGRGQEELARRTVRLLNGSAEQ